MEACDLHGLKKCQLYAANVVFYFNVSDKIMPSKVPAKTGCSSLTTQVTIPPGQDICWALRGHSWFFPARAFCSSRSKAAAGTFARRARWFAAAELLGAVDLAWVCADAPEPLGKRKELREAHCKLGAYRSPRSQSMSLSGKGFETTT